MFYVLRCPKCYTYRAGDDKNKSWRCFKCQYNMNRKNTKVQAKAISVEEVQFVIDSLKRKQSLWVNHIWLVHFLIIQDTTQALYRLNVTDFADER